MQLDALQIGLFCFVMVFLSLDLAARVIGPMVSTIVQAEEKALVFFSWLFELCRAVQTSGNGGFGGAVVSMMIIHQA